MHSNLRCLSTNPIRSILMLTLGRSSTLVFSILGAAMPKYAVAVGRQPGIYDSWAECKLQIDGFKGATYKKFDTKESAEAFITQNCVGKKRQLSVDRSEIDSPYVRPENANRPKMMKIEPISPSDALSFAFNSRLAALEAKLTSFMETTTKMLEDFSSRIVSLENIGGNPSNQNIHKSPDLNLPEGDYQINDKGFVNVYTDGACSHNGQQGAKAGIGVWFNHYHPLNVSAPVKGSPTNNTAEIQAARVAISQAASAGVKRLSIHTDSKFVIDCITKWIHRWKKNGWKLTSGGVVKNKTELIKLESAIQLVDQVEWIHVRGHQGTLGNEMADSLAREGATKYQTNVRYADHVDGDIVTEDVLVTNNNE